MVTGIAIAQCGEEGKPLLKFFESISIVMMKVIKMITMTRITMITMMLIILLQVTTWIIHLAPVGVCFLIAGQILEMEVVSPHIVRSLKLRFAFSWARSSSRS